MIPKNDFFTNHVYLIDMYEQDLALNNLQELVCHKIQPAKSVYKDETLRAQRYRPYFTPSTQSFAYNS